MLADHPAETDVAAELVASLRPANWPGDELAAGGGNYVRNHGTWLYAATREPVPGASDVTLAARYAASPRVVRDGREHVLLDRDWLEGPQARPELAWCAAVAVELADERPPLTHAVPVAELAARGDVVVTMFAPELHPADLLTASAIARLVGVTRTTVNAYHSRGQMPPPVTTLNQRLPLWTRPVIDHWIARQTRRRFRG
jgi:predicted DNA-binding transcriptional regulator AlpA